jgi:hypothetical protein
MAALLSRVQVHKVFAMSASSVSERGVAQALKEVVDRVDLARSKAGRAKPVRRNITHHAF